MSHESMIGADGSATTYAELLRRVTAASPTAEAVVFPGARLTYAELLERATWRARELRALGVGSGDRVGLLLPNGLPIIELLLGSALIGAVAVPINTRFRSFEIAHVCADAGVSVIFSTDEVDEHVDFKSILADALPGLHQADPAMLRIHGYPKLRAVAMVTDSRVPGMLDAATLREMAAEQPAPDAGDGPSGDDPLMLLYTSGTTAAPKGCVVPNRAIVANTANIAIHWKITASDGWWNPLPMFHLGGVLLMTAAFQRGATHISQTHFDADEAIELIIAERPSVLYPLFPTITLALVHHERFAELPLDEIRAVGSVAPEDLQRRIQAAFPHAVVVNAYGMTELCGSAAYSRLDDALEDRMNTSGPPLPGYELRVIDPETGEEVESGVPGELLVRGPAIFAGYFGDPEATAACHDDDGYFHTGDRCSLDGSGQLTFHGRLKDMLKVGGENVSALEVESFLATHPAVKLAQVVGIPDDRLLEVPVAFVELIDGASLTEEELILYCTGKIARFKIPRKVCIVQEWPMSSTKIQKFKLRERLLTSEAAR